jgi:hypothetical protein
VSESKSQKNTLGKAEVIKMALYTFFLEYDGGTYISQVEAENQTQAPKVWATGFDLNNKREYARFFEPDFSVKLIESLDLNLITDLDGIANTWAWSAYRVQRPTTIHFTQTVQE